MRRDRKWEMGWKFGTNKKEAERKREGVKESEREREK